MSSDENDSMGRMGAVDSDAAGLRGRVRGRGESVHRRHNPVNGPEFQQPGQDLSGGGGVYGLCGDDDVGQMSAWFVLAASGIHQACPGDTRCEFFTPLFDRVDVRIDPVYGAGKIFSIVAQSNGPGPRYIQSAKLNGQPIDRFWLDHKEIVAGGLLELELGPEPNKNWGCRDS